jgi:3-hydroxyisobutyrate dehydrogenase-like beta-hydroxyacid dehydrogenase
VSERILLLHPGAMGSSIGASLRGNAHAVAWVREGRSAASAERAGSAGLQPVATLREGLAGIDHVISVCPPDAALAVAHQVTTAGFAGTYLDANAVSPASAREMHALLADAFVDGGIVGPPAWKAGTTRLYLSGPKAAEVARWFEGSATDARAIAGGAGAASALKMAYAAFTKGSAALLLAIRALAEREGVTAPLLEEWDLSQPGLAQRSQLTARGTSGKAWRFEGEMREIAATFQAAGLPGGFHEAAAEVYRRMRDLKDVEGGADLESVLEALLRDARPASRSPDPG